MSTSNLTEDDIGVLEIVKAYNDKPAAGKTKADGPNPCPSSEILRVFDQDKRQPPPVHAMRSMVVKQYLQTNAAGQRGLQYIMTDLGRAKLAEAKPEAKPEAKKTQRTPDEPPKTDK